ncbi:MAG: dTMP kinase [Planctomycetes bacterium]|nr:dTMP kinase [Planctomycetota bacterium]
MTRGLFLSLDGLDGAGKSTQSRLLAEWLCGRGWEVTTCSDPGGTEIGKLLRELLLDRRRQMTLACEAFLFMASRAQLTAEIIRPALQAGRAVISDRFLLANVVYQGHAGGLDPGLLHAMGLLATGGLEPDLTLVLDLPVDTALSRRQGPADRVESRAGDYHARVRAGFLAEAQRQPERIRILDASRPVADVHDEICRAVLDLAKR